MNKKVLISLVIVVVLAGVMVSAYLHSRNQGTMLTKGFKTLESVPPESFDIHSTIWPCYTRRANSIIFTHQDASLPANADSFRTIGTEDDSSDSCYGKDSQHVYFQTQIVSGADPATFHFLDQGEYFSADTNHIYIAARQLKDVIPESFTDLGGGYAKTKDSVYYFWPGLSNDGTPNGDLTTISGADPATFTVVSNQATYDAQDHSRKYFQGEPVK